MDITSNTPLVHFSFGVFDFQNCEFSFIFIYLNRFLIMVELFFIVTKMLPSLLTNRLLSVRIGSFQMHGKCAPQFGPICQLHTSTAQCFHFMKKQTTVDPEIAKLRENRKRRKLVKAIKTLVDFSKKPLPVEEIQMDLRHRQTLEQRKRTEDRGEGREDVIKETYRRKRMLKQYAQSRARLAKNDILWIKQSTEAQQKALEVLKQLSPALYEAAVQPDEHLFFTQIQGPPISPPIDEYQSLDGEYQDVTKKWEQPTLVEMEKKFGVGKLIKMPEFKKKQIMLQRQKAEEEEEQKVRKNPWMTKESRAEEEGEANAVTAKA